MEKCSFLLSASRVKKLEQKDEARIASGMLAVDGFPPLLRRQGVGCPAETGRRKGGDLGIILCPHPQYNAQLEKERGSAFGKKKKKNWMA